MTIKHYLLAVAAVAISALPLAVLAEAKPNVLFIAVDDLNDWVGCLDGHPQAKTPNIDRLAERGVLFTNAHCAAPACGPSRAAIFSGQMPYRTQMWSNQSPPLLKLCPQTMLLPLPFARAGYRTLGAGKLVGNKAASKMAFAEYLSVEQRWSPFTKNAVRYTDTELTTKGTGNPRHVVRDSQGRQIVLPLNRMPSDRKPDVMEGESFDWGPFDVPSSGFGDTQITDWAIEKMKQACDKPIFLAVGYYRPHIPLWAPQKY